LQLTKVTFKILGDVFGSEVKLQLIRTCPPHLRPFSNFGAKKLPVKHDLFGAFLLTNQKRAI
jgi:hypothetical protein